MGGIFPWYIYNKSLQGILYISYNFIGQLYLGKVEKIKYFDRKEK